MRYREDFSEKGKQIYQVSPTSNILSFIKHNKRFQLIADMTRWDSPRRCGGILDLYKWICSAFIPVVLRLLWAIKIIFIFAFALPTKFLVFLVWKVHYTKKVRRYVIWSVKVNLLKFKIIKYWKCKSEFASLSK